jgi:hypothetical protein
MANTTDTTHAQRNIEIHSLIERIQSNVYSRKRPLSIFNSISAVKSFFKQ